MMGDLAKELDFHFIRCGKVLVGNTDEDMETLKRTIEQGKDNGATNLELIDEKRLHELVSCCSRKVCHVFPITAVL